MLKLRILVCFLLFGTVLCGDVYAKEYSLGDLSKNMKQNYYGENDELRGWYQEFLNNLSVEVKGSVMNLKISSINGEAISYQREVTLNNNIIKFNLMKETDLKKDPNMVTIAMIDALVAQQILYSAFLLQASSNTSFLQFQTQLENNKNYIDYGISIVTKDTATSSEKLTYMTKFEINLNKFLKEQTTEDIENPQTGMKIPYGILLGGFLGVIFLYILKKYHPFYKI